MGGGTDITVHASCISWQGKGALIRGTSGCGKSTLALQMLAYGCDLVADDRVILRANADKIWAYAPQAISGLIEARGVGLLNAAVVETAPVTVVVDLGEPEPQRLPEPRKIVLLGQSVPLLRARPEPHFAAALLQFLKAGRRDNV